MGSEIPLLLMHHRVYHSELAAIRAELARLADPANVAAIRRFFKETVDPYGLRAADLNALIRSTGQRIAGWPVAERNRLCTELLKSGRFEEGQIALVVYRRFRRSCGRCEFKLFERWLDRYVTNWAHCDGLAMHLLDAAIGNEADLAEELPEWTRSPNRWKRRAAAVALVRSGRYGRHRELIGRVAALLREDSDPMVQKAVGWLLKESYRSHPREVVRLLRRDAWPRLVLRYAAEKMTEEDRRTILGS